LKTGKQIFKEFIVDQIDRSITVQSIVDITLTTYEFTVCGTKWMTEGQIFTLNGYDWTIVSVDIESNTIISTIPDELAVINKNDTILIQTPTFLSGTPKNLNGENQLRDRNGVTLVMPIIWLLESLSGSDMTKENYHAKEFDFQFYCLTLFNGEDWLNDDRHSKCVFPMTQLKDEILRVIDYSYDVNRDSDSSFTEFSRFGREDSSGFQKYILDLNLSGVECQITVQVDRDNCNC